MIEHLNDLKVRLVRIETLLCELRTQRMIKDSYTTTEVVEAINRSEYTVREWCRKGQVPGRKAANGRGWLIAHADLLRLRNGELPTPEHRLHREVHR